MSPDDLRRVLALVKERRWPLDFATRYYGLDFNPEARGRRDYELWMRQRKHPEPLKGDTIDRWWLETFLQNRNLMPLKWMALQLGMTVESLRNLRRKMDEVGPLLAYHVSPDLIGKSFEDDLLAELPQYRFRTFSDHDDFCRHLHDWTSERYTLPIEQEVCMTSRHVGRGTDYAKYIDIITHEPLSPRYQMWLDFGKWMTLPPDRCSVLLFAAHRGDITPYVAGREPPDVPPEVEKVKAEAPR